jgi:hypothetical protein
MKHRLITIYSDKQKQIQPKLSPEEQSDILALKDLLGSQHVSLYASDVLFIRHYVGFIARGRTRLQILPKIYSDYGLIDTEEEKNASIQLLLRLLSYSGYLHYKNIPDPQTIDSCNNDLFEIFWISSKEIFIDRMNHTKRTNNSLKARSSSMKPSSETHLGRIGIMFVAMSLPITRC